MTLVDEPLEKLMRIVVFFVVELSISRPNSRNHPSVTNNTSRALHPLHSFEKIGKLIYQVVLLSVTRLPINHLVPEGAAVVEDLDS